jgi:hypothetical protein
MEITVTRNHGMGSVTIGTRTASGPDDLENGLTVFGGETFRTYHFALIRGRVNLRWTTNAWTTVDAIPGRYDRIEDALPEIRSWLNSYGEF